MKTEGLGGGGKESLATPLVRGRVCGTKRRGRISCSYSKQVLELCHLQLGHFKKKL